jgi:acyl-CoA reductase-like NAD-dependent aldehyde dehydrogenase
MATRSTATQRKIKSNQDYSKSVAIAPSRLEVRKTFKLYIDGKFPRTESGRVFQLKDASGAVLANICRGSRKDLRDSIVSNRKAQEGWAKRSAYNKAQILYRIAETLESRKGQFVDVLMLQGMAQKDARDEVEASIDLLVYYAGWSDKYIQVFSAVNPVESSHFNFSYPEPVGLVMAISPVGHGLLGLVALMAPAIVGGNTCTILASENYPMTAVDFAEVLHASDVPGGVVNILTGHRKEFLSHASAHMDVNAFLYLDLDQESKKLVQTNAAVNVKRMVDFDGEDLLSPYTILSMQEIKTTWHPIGN